MVIGAKLLFIQIIDAGCLSGVCWLFTGPSPEGDDTGTSDRASTARVRKMEQASIKARMVGINNGH
jgi:hypothetical protein